jgi:hypothetical protein
MSRFAPKSLLNIDSGLDRRLDVGVPYFGSGGFSPDGTKLLLGRVAGPGTAELVIVPADDAGSAIAIGGPHRTMGGGVGWADVVWSPDGKHILATYYEPTVDAYAPTTWLLDVASGGTPDAVGSLQRQDMAASGPIAGGRQPLPILEKS